MRIATWNCREGTNREMSTFLDRVAPDIVVVPESCRTPAIAGVSLLNDGVPHVWTGDLDTKGLAIYAPSAHQLVVVPPPTANGARHAIAARAELDGGHVTLLGLWTVPHPRGARATPYMNAVEQLLADYDKLLEQGTTIVAGDFNCSAQSSPDAFPQFLKAIRDRYGLASAYHAHHGIQPGNEDHMTLWWRGRENAGYHCDLILIPETWVVESVAVGSYAEWGHPDGPACSDHSPVIADLTRRPGL